MFRELQRLFQRSVEAFRAELGKMEPEDQVAELLASMRRELVAARAEIPELTREVERSRADLARERGELEQCQRRQLMAERIGDSETARIAGDFAERHRARAAVLEQKLTAIEAELTLRTAEADEMKRRYQEADANRFALLAELRRSQTRRRMDEHTGGSQSAFADFQRMEDSIEGSEGYAAALDDLDAELGGGGAAPPRRPTPEELDARLEELKRRMGRD